MDNLQNLSWGLERCPPPSKNRVEQEFYDGKVPESEFVPRKRVTSCTSMDQLFNRFLFGSSHFERYKQSRVQENAVKEVSELRYPSQTIV